MASAEKFFSEFHPNYSMKEINRNNLSRLRNLEFDLANYFSNTIIPQLFVDADLILRLFTPPAMKQFSLSHHDLNRSIEDVKDNIKYPTVVENIKEVIKTGRVLEKEVQTTDGKWYEMNIQPYNEVEEDRINGVIITFVDISYRFNALKELERLNAKHEVLMFALSHDLRQPISSMMLLLNGLREANKRKDGENFEKWMQSLEKSLHTMKDLVTDFTEESQPDEEKPQEKSIMDLQEICESVIDSLKEMLVSHNIKIIRNFESAQINFPRNNLRSIIYNLLHNAIKFSDPNKDSKIEMTITSFQGRVFLCVEDNGIGIPAEKQRDIFKKSSRLNQEIAGTGMGLYIVKRMIESQEGRIKMESTPGEGTLFKVFFQAPFQAKKSG